MLISKLDAVDEDDFDIETPLREALANAIIHGNHENPHKRVYVTCRCRLDGEISITVRDEGEGFDSDGVPDPTDANNRLLDHGRGIYFMRALMDDVWFEEGGKVVYMRKRLRANSPEEAAAQSPRDLREALGDNSQAWQLVEVCLATRYCAQCGFLWWVPG
jgi:anti-sigma regulatory factor (Ser/Thr protein kinase)